MNSIAVRGIKVVVVPDAYRHVALRDFKQVVVDEKTGILNIAKDISNEQLVLVEVSVLLLLLGRIKVCEHASVARVLEVFSKACARKNFHGRVIIAGPLPSAKDDIKFCKRLCDTHEQWKQALLKHPFIHFCDAGDVLMDQFGVVPQLLDERGLTIDRVRELREGFAGV